MIPEHILNRKGARSFKDLDPEVISYLNAGKIQTKNLMEWLATDQLELLKVLLASINKSEWYDSFNIAVNAQKKPTANSNVKIIGQTFAQLADSGFVQTNLSDHQSDIVRSWACWAESLFHDSTKALLNAMKPYAADLHFGVREVVIFASKERLALDLEGALAILSLWVLEDDENVRRYAIEAMRPVGVWTKKIPEFQENPEKGLALLAPLISDTSKYVRDSVGNWLNDASKSKPDWVLSVCEQWKAESSSKETAYILKKAMRTILK